MTIHLAIDEKGNCFGIYKDGELMAQGTWFNDSEIMAALGIEKHMIVYKPEEIEGAFNRLPATVAEIEITEILTEDAGAEIARKIL
jgi:hypothetical protein